MTRLGHASRLGILGALSALAVQAADEFVQLEGDQVVWRPVTLTFRGPHARETDSTPNPFTDYCLTVTFQHDQGASFKVPGYFAADGRAADTSASEGDRWRVHFVPNLPGLWRWSAEFVAGPHVATSGEAGRPVPPVHGATGEFMIQATSGATSAWDRGCLVVVPGARYRKFAGSGQWFLKAGTDSPETLLAYADFDGTRATKSNAPLKTYASHVQDWRPGDPVWKGDRGKGLIGALNYLASAGVNSISMLTYNAGGDGDNVWPFVERDDKLHYDVSKLDQWRRVFEHAARLGLHLHFKLQETENDDHRPKPTPTALDGGALGPERKLYLRELVARFAHLPALTWNLGEECTLSTEELVAMARYLRSLDPYDHHVVAHTFPNKQEEVYTPLLGRADVLTGVSLQNPWNVAHERTWTWVHRSREAGHVWVVGHDEQNPAELGVPPDEGYQGLDGVAKPKKGTAYTRHDIRRLCLWGTWMAGGEGVEYYFGYQLPHNDLNAEDFRSRAASWADARRGRRFFEENSIPFWAMDNADELVGNPQRKNTVYCFAQPGQVYVVYLPNGGTVELDLRAAQGQFEVRWFDPRTEGPAAGIPAGSVRGGDKVKLGPPPAMPNEDWVVWLRRAQ